MAVRNVGIVSVGVVTVGVALVWGYSVFGPQSQPSVVVEDVQGPAWQVKVEDAVPVTEETLPVQ